MMLSVPIYCPHEICIQSRIAAMIWGLSVTCAFMGYTNFSQQAADKSLETETYYRLLSIFSKNKYGYNTRFMSDFEIFLEAVLNERFLDESVAYYQDELTSREIRQIIKMQSTDMNTGETQLGDRVQGVKIFGMDSNKFVPIFNMILGLSLCVYSFGTFFYFTNYGDAVIVVYCFRVYQVFTLLGRVFGFLIFASFCDFKFMKDYFLFLKTTAGKGYFNIFLASTFLVGNNKPIVGYALAIFFLICGLFFIIVGHCSVSVYDNADFDSRAIAKQAANKTASTAYENRHLLDDNNNANQA